MTEKTIRGILIDPFTKTITEVRVPVGDDSAYKGLQAAVFPDYPAKGSGLITSVSLSDDDTLFVDDEGLLQDWDDTAFFAWGVQRSLAGRGIVVGTDEEGDSVDAKISLEQVKADVEWVDAKNVRAPAPTYTSFGRDGKPETTLLHGVEVWDYHSQPAKGGK